jgi:hypothetical protein
MHPFNPHMFIRNFLAQFIQKPGEMMAVEEALVVQEFTKQVNDHRYLNQVGCICCTLLTLLTRKRDPMWYTH